MYMSSGFFFAIVVAVAAMWYAESGPHLTQLVGLN